MRQPPKADPTFYSSWHTWAKELLKYMQHQNEELTKPNSQLQTYNATSLPSAAQAGQLVWVATGQVAVSTATGGWKYLRFVT